MIDEVRAEIEKKSYDELNALLVSTIKFIKEDRSVFEDYLRANPNLAYAYKLLPNIFKQKQSQQQRQQIQQQRQQNFPAHKPQTQFGRNYPH